MQCLRSIRAGLLWRITNKNCRNMNCSVRTVAKRDISLSSLVFYSILISRIPWHIHQCIVWRNGLKIKSLKIYAILFLVTKNICSAYFQPVDTPLLRKGSAHMGVLHIDETPFVPPSRVYRPPDWAQLGQSWDQSAHPWEECAGNSD